MISVFQIFRALIGLIVLVFVLVFFLRVTELYSGVQEMGKHLETVDEFNRIAMQTYITGNPATFSGFRDFETLVYDPPKIRSDAGQKTLNVPVLMIMGSGEMKLERRCSDYGWFKFCWVYAFPVTSKVIFNPMENTAETRELIRDVAAELPDGLQFGYCNGSLAQASTKANFLDYMDVIAGKSYERCSVNVSSGHRIVHVGAFNELVPNAVSIDTSAGEMSRNVTGFVETVAYNNALEVAAFILGGNGSLEYWNGVFFDDMQSAADMMRKRTILVHQSMQEYNKQPCIECSTPFPELCGWVDYRGYIYVSDAYLEFISSLEELIEYEMGDDYQGTLAETALEYAVLEYGGCE